MFGFIGNIGPWELVFILLVALIVVGPGKLPEVAKSMGKAMGDFKRATNGVQKEINDVMKFDDDKPSMVKKESAAIVNTNSQVTSRTEEKVENKAEEKAGTKVEDKVEDKSDD